MAAALCDGSALLVRNHGLVTCGGSIEAATITAVVLDRAARAQLLAMALPVLRPASPAEMDGREALLRSPVFVNQTFAYYSRRADRSLSTGKCMQ